jgi:hypothetical protein
MHYPATRGTETRSLRGSVARIRGRGCGGRRPASTVFDRWTKGLPPTRARTTTKRAKAVISLAAIGRPLGRLKRAFVAGDRNGKGCPEPVVPAELRIGRVGWTNDLRRNASGRRGCAISGQSSPREQRRMGRPEAGTRPHYR